jgi:hypothetical protein
MGELQAHEETKKVYAAPLAAIVSALSSLACCLPLAILGALGTASAGAVFAALRPWLLVLSAVLLAIGFIQLYRRGKSCRRRNVASVAIFWIAVAIFLAMLLFPQQVAGLLPGRWTL